MLTAPNSAGALLGDEDRRLLQWWAVELRAAGWSRSSSVRSVRRVRAFARSLMTPGGLLTAAEMDVARFAAAAANVRRLNFNLFIRSHSWRLTVAALRQFYRFATARGLCSAKASPVRKLVLHPVPLLSAKSTAPRDADAHQRVLNAPGLSRRTTAILTLLAHVLLPSEVCAVRLEDLDLDAGFVAIRDAAGVRVRWRVRITSRAAQTLRAYVRSRHLAGRLFPGRDPRGCASAAIVRRTVTQAVAAAFPRPAQARRRRRVCALGFRTLYLTRIVNARVSAGTIQDLTRFIDLANLKPYLDPRSRHDARHELLRITKRWRNWIA